MTPEQKSKAIDDLAKSMSKLCHAVIRKRLTQFFDVIEEEMAKRPRCGACSPAEVGGPTCACATQETGVRYCPHCGKSEPHEHQGRPYPSPANVSG
jgi:hypothetical protein